VTDTFLDPRSTLLP